MTATEGLGKDVLLLVLATIVIWITPVNQATGVERVIWNVAVVFFYLSMLFNLGTRCVLLAFEWWDHNH